MRQKAVKIELANPRKMSDKILQKAIQLFLLKGYEATSTNDICWASKITKPTLYYYFPSKRHVLHAAHIQNLQNVLQPYLDKCGAIEDPLERLHTMLKDYSIMICSHPELRFLLHETLNIKDEHANVVKKEWKKHYLLLRDTIAELQKKQKIRSGLKPSGAALLLLGMITWITYWFDHKRKDSINSTVDLVIDMGFHALGLQAYQTKKKNSVKGRNRADK